MIVPRATAAMTPGGIFPDDAGLDEAGGEGAALVDVVLRTAGAVTAVLKEAKVVTELSNFGAALTVD